MKKKVLLSASLTAGLVMGVAAVNWAVVPPPPVNQNLGIYDTKFGNLTQDECNACHINSNYPTHTALAQRHHALINTVTPAASCIRQPGQPASLATGCHVLVSDGTGGFVFEDFRNCLNCHTTSPHHITTAALQRDCQHCHGSLIDNPLDGHYVPTYGISSVTPLPDGRTVAVPGTTQTAIVQGCEACHQAAPAATPKPIFSNADTHHGTGIGQPGQGDCTWCHSVTSSITIRQCESCHGVKSLHNIQADTPAAANLGSIVPGAENLGYGHIGNNWDCQGCHWSWYGNSSPFTAATVPFVSGTNGLVANVGQETTLTLNGSSFTNIGGDGSTVYNPTVTITNGSTSITLQPFSVTESEIKVLVPALQEGVYDLKVVKDGVQSNLVKLTAAPKAQFKAAVLGSKTNVTITGQNFGIAPPAEYNSGMGVFVGDKPARIVSWSPSKIVADSRDFKAGATVVVKTLFGSASGTISGATKKTR